MGKLFSSIPARPKISLTRLLTIRRRFSSAGALNSTSTRSKPLAISRNRLPKFSSRTNTLTIPASWRNSPTPKSTCSQKIADGVYLIQAVGHTTGNSIIIAEGDGIFYMPLPTPTRRSTKTNCPSSLKICPPTGSARAAASPKINSTGLKEFSL